MVGSANTATSKWKLKDVFNVYKIKNYYIIRFKWHSIPTNFSYIFKYRIWYTL